MFLDDVIHEDDHTVALAKALASCFVIRGAQLSVVKRLQSQYVVGVHLSSISWIIKRLANYAANNNNKMVKKGVLFFRSLQHLVSTIESRDVLQMYVFFGRTYFSNNDFFSEKHISIRLQHRRNSKSNSP